MLKHMQYTFAVNIKPLSKYEKKPFTFYFYFYAT